MKISAFVVLQAAACLVALSGAEAAALSGAGVSRTLLSDQKYCAFLNGRLIPCPTTQISQSKPPPPPPPGGQDVDRCALDGELQAAIVAESACEEVVAFCVAEPEAQALGAFKVSEDRADDLLRGVLEKACKVVAIETCKNKAFDATAGIEGKCNSVLSDGPDPDNLADADFCATIIDANAIFDLKVNRLCEEAFP